MRSLPSKGRPRGRTSPRVPQKRKRHNMHSMDNMGTGLRIQLWRGSLTGPL